MDFSNKQSVFIENLGQIHFNESLPEKYNGCPKFNF